VSSDPAAVWLAALDDRHLADLTPQEVTRALRALSSCYVHRRDRIRTGGALDGAGKRAAFALFYAPQHFLLTRTIAPALGVPSFIRRVVDLGCGTGAAGAAVALDAPGTAVDGFDLSSWAVHEANWTYRTLRIAGRATVRPIAKVRLKPTPGSLVLAGWAVNELPDPQQAELVERLLAAHAAGAAVLVVEPIGRRANPWWAEWAAAFGAAGGREDDWRIPNTLPARQRGLGEAAGLTVDELTARSLYLPPRG
jgi:SAM-dependent methyltransferase